MQKLIIFLKVKYSVYPALQLDFAFDSLLEAEGKIILKKRLYKKLFIFTFCKPGVLLENDKVCCLQAPHWGHHVLPRSGQKLLLKSWLRIYHHIRDYFDLFCIPCFDQQAILLISHLETNCERLEWQARNIWNNEKVSVI